MISISSSSSVAKPFANLPSSRNAFNFVSTSTSFARDLSFLEPLIDFDNLLSIISMSEKINSKFIVSISLSGSMEPST